MNKIKKTILTLVALLALTTQAWAQDPNAVTAAEINSDLYSGWSSIDGVLIKASELPGFQAVTEDQAKSWTGAPSTGTVELFYEFVADGQVKAVRFVNGVYDSSFMEEDLERNLIWEDIKYNDAKYFYTTGPAPTGPKVAWDKAKKTGTFTMPGGNVTLEPEYYPQATVADGGVTAADADARATTDDPLVKVDATKLTGAKKLMYFVSNSGTAPAYDAEGWTDQLPTAEGFTQQGIVYVWYYPVGTDEGVDGATATYSDGDMNATALAVSLAAAPLWNAEFDLTDAPEADKAGKWSTDIPEGGVVKGTEVKVTYTGSKKVIGVKAEKKAAPTVLVTAITLNKTTTTIYKVNDSSTETLSVTAVTPDEATDKTYTWSSDNTAVATVDASTGEVTAVAVGTAHIRATANDGTGVYGECTVTVSDLSAYYSKMKECGCDDLENKCVTYDDDDNSHFTGQVLSAAQAIALAKAKAAETGSNCAVFYDNGYPGQIRFAKNDGTTGQGFCDYSASQKGLSGYKGYYVSK